MSILQLFVDTIYKLNEIEVEYDLFSAKPKIVRAKNKKTGAAPGPTRNSLGRRRRPQSG
jgi:hypothetical protein